MSDITKVIRLRPDSELIVGGTAVALVFAIFGNAMPPLSDVRYDEPGNVNTHKTTKLAGITATAAVGSLALLGRSPTVAVVGGAAILFEMWKYHAANYGANGQKDNATQTAPGKTAGS
jgi:hypothetical protein